MKDNNQQSKVFWKHPILLGAWLACAGICFAVLRIGTDVPLWVCVLAAFPLGLGLTLLAIKMTGD